MVPKTHAIAISVSWALKNRLSLKNVLSRRTATRPHNLPSSHVKIEFAEIDEEMFQGVERQCENIFCILSIGKSDFDKFAKVKF
jgi:hypothetical protein